MRRRSGRYEPVEEEEPMQLDQVLEPYHGQQEPGEGAEEPYGAPPGEEDPYAAQPLYEQEPPYGEEPYDGQPYEEDDYSDYHEELDHEGRMRTAMGIFDTISTLVGVVAVLVLVGMLLSLLSWLQTDVTHSITLLQSGLQ